MAANDLSYGVAVQQVAHHRSAADLVEEVCWRTDNTTPQSVTNRRVHHSQQPLHQQPRKQELALWYLHRPAWVEVPHGWVAVNTHITPVLTKKTKHEKNTHTKTKQKNEKDPGTKKMKKKKQVRMSDSSAPQLHDRLTCPRAQRHAQTASTHARASALVFSSSCLNESTSRVGPGQYPQYTRAPSEKGMWVAHHQHNS